MLTTVIFIALAVLVTVVIAALGRRAATAQAYDKLCTQRGESERAERHRGSCASGGSPP